MIVDKRTEFFAGAAIPAAAGTALVGDVIDLSVARDIGNGQPIYWYSAAVTPAVGGTSVQLQLVSSDAATITSPVVHASTGVIPLAQLNPSKLLAQFSVPLEGPEYKRYLAVRAVTVGAFTGGTITSGLTLDPHGNKAYGKRSD